MTPSPEIVNTTSMWHYSACRHVGEISKMEENVFHTKQLHHSHLPFRAGKYRKKVFYEEKGFPKENCMVWSLLERSCQIFQLKGDIFGKHLLSKEFCFLLLDSAKSRKIIFDRAWTVELHFFVLRPAFCFDLRL